VASYATAIAMPADALADLDNKLLLKDYVGESHRQGLMVLAYPLSDKTDSIASPPDFRALVDFYFSRAGIDGMYTDSFRDVQRYIKEQTEQTAIKAIAPALHEESPPIAPEVPLQNEDLPPFFKNLNLARPPLPNAEEADKQVGTAPE
jgi:hypothetical protein